LTQQNSLAASTASAVVDEHQHQTINNVGLLSSVNGAFYERFIIALSGKQPPQGEIWAF